MSFKDSETSKEGFEKIPTAVPLSNKHDRTLQPDKVLEETGMSRGKELTNQGTEEARISEEMANLYVVSVEDVETYPPSAFGKYPSTRRMDNTDKSGGFKNLNEAIEKSAIISHEAHGIPIENSTRPSVRNTDHFTNLSRNEKGVIQAQKTAIYARIVQKDEKSKIHRDARTCIPMSYLLNSLESGHQQTKCILDRMLNEYDLYNINFNAVKSLPIWDPLSRTILEDSGHSATLVLGDILIEEAYQLMDGMEVSFGMWEVIHKEFNSIKEFLSQHNSICNSFNCCCREVQEVKKRMTELMFQMRKLMLYRNDKDCAISLSDEKLKDYLPSARHLLTVRNIPPQVRECLF